MRSILNEDNIRNDLMKVFDRYPVTVDVKHLSKKFFEIARKCAQNSCEFNEITTFNMIFEVVEDRDLALEVWSILVMYAFEGMCWKLLRKHDVVDNEDMFIMCLSTVVQCAHMYDIDSGIKLSTYLYTSIENNIRAEKREEAFFRVPHAYGREIAIITDLYMKDQNVTVEDIREKTGLSKKVATSILNAVRTHNALSLETGGEDQDPILNSVSTNENIPMEYIQAEDDAVVEQEFLPIVADVFGNDIAFITMMRAGPVWGHAKRKFEDMEDDFCRYLSFSNNLKIFASKSPTYKAVCEKIDLIYATRGKQAMMDYVASRSGSEQMLINKILAMSEKEADSAIKERVSSECFKQVHTIRFLFSRAFPYKGITLTGADRMRIRHFKHQLRMKGLGKVADAITTKSSKQASGSC